MAVEETPLGFLKPDGNEPVRQGDNVIAHNAQRANDLIVGLQNGIVETNFDGGGPGTIFAPEQTIDGGTI